MEVVWRFLLAGLVLTGSANAVTSDSEQRSSLILPAPPWRGSAVLPSSDIYETPTATPAWDDAYSTPEPDPYSDETWYPVPTVAEPSTTPPSPSYSAIVTVRTTTWVISRSTTVTSIIFETYYSTLTDYHGSAEGGTVTVTTSVTETESGSAPPSPSDPCAAAASGRPSEYASECSSWSSSAPSEGPVTTITWSPAVTAYPLPSSSDEDEGRAPASTSTTSSAASSSTTTTTTTTTSAETESPTATSSENESPPVVTGAAAPLHNANTRVLAAAAALFAVLA
ncbi:hypothetical protein J3F83DRAFT_718365 [Trichoderma novae-zelandiae]